MTILLGLLGILLGVVLRRRWAGKLSLTAWGATLVALIAAGCGPLAKGLTQELQADYAKPISLDWKTRSVIVVLGLGTEKVQGTNVTEVGALAYGRLVKGLELYRECKSRQSKCTILISGGDIQGNGRPEASVYADAMKRMGVSDTDIVLDATSKNTWENARNTAGLLKPLQPETVVLVTSGVHMRRSLLYFAHFGVHPVPARSDYLNPILSFIPIAFNLMATDIALHEHVGVLRFHIYNALGLNESASHDR